MQLAIPSIGAERTPGSLQPDNHEAVMRQFIGVVINNGDYSALNDLVHPDYVYRSPGEELRGPDGLTALFRGYRGAFPDLRVAIDDLLAAGDTTVLSFT